MRRGMAGAVVALGLLLSAGACGGDGDDTTGDAEVEDTGIEPGDDVGADGTGTESEDSDPAADQDQGRSGEGGSAGGSGNEVEGESTDPTTE